MGLVLRGQSFTLRLTVEWCCELQDRTGLSFDDLASRVNRGRAQDVRALLWASLQDRHQLEVPTVEAAGALIDAMGGLAQARRILREFLERNLDESEDEQTGQAEKSTDPKRPWRRLYLDARSVGLDGAAFWKLSLKELWLEIAAARRRHRDVQEQAIQLAWWCRALVWTKDLPDLNGLLKRTRTNAGPQHGIAMLAAMEQISAQYGIKLTHQAKKKD